MEKRTLKEEEKGGFAIFIVGLCAAALVCCALPGPFFDSVRGIAMGLFGVFAYVLFAAGAAIGILSYLRVSPGVSRKKIILMTAVFFVLLCLVHLFSTWNMTGGKTFSEYCSAVYAKKTTAGGLFANLVVYPMQRYFGGVASVIVFAVLAVVLSMAALDFVSRRKGLRALHPGEGKRTPSFERGELSGYGRPVNELYVSDIETDAKKKERAFSQMDDDNDRDAEYDAPRPSPEDARSDKRKKLFDGANFAFSGAVADEPAPAVKKASARELLFGSSKKTLGEAEDEVAERRVDAGGQVLTENGYMVPSVTQTKSAARPVKIVHDDGNSFRSSLAPEEEFSVTPPPRSGFGVAVDNPNPIINGDSYSKALERENFSGRERGQSRASARSQWGAESSETRDVSKPVKISAEPAKKFDGDTGSYGSGINARAYAPFSFDAVIDGGSSSPSGASFVPGAIVTDAVAREEETDVTRSVRNSAARPAEVIEPLNNPAIISGDATGYYEVEPAREVTFSPAPEAKVAEEFENRVRDVDRAFAEALKEEKSVARKPRSARIKPDNQVNIEDFAVEESRGRLEREGAVKASAPYIPAPYSPPPLDLLRTLSTDTEDDGVDYHEKAQALEILLEEFKVPSKVIGITHGPAVTRYELEVVQPGISVRKIDSFSHDIAYKLEAKGEIRVQAPIPGKMAVGIEVPNENIATVALKDIMRGVEFEASENPLTFAVGKDIAGKCIVGDLTKMVHVLIAGQTGSGKSSCLNSLITSMIYKTSPEVLRLILIDPKRVEFSNYADLPHLMLPEIITDVDKAVNALKWALKEMDRRFDVFHAERVRDIGEFNAREAVAGGTEPRMPYIVIVVDELADLMARSKRDVETCINKLAQLSRAAGIHLVLATQRPSVDVITGTIKANLPSRIAFAVSSFVDSKTILDQGGAEKLLGRGDMLFSPQGAREPERVQGAFITGDEVNSILDYIRAHNGSVYDDSVAAEINFVKKEEAEEFAAEQDEDKDDEYLADATRLVIESGMASISMVQRRFAIGYARAARIIDQMELRKWISPFEGSKSRQVYITMEQWREIFENGDGE